MRLLAVVSVVLLPGAAAAGFDLTSAEAVAFDGDVTAAATAGNGFVDLAPPFGATANATGRLSYFTWSVVRVDDNKWTSEDARREDFDLAGSPLALASPEDPVALRFAVHPGGRAAVAGAVHGAGLPAVRGGADDQVVAEAPAAWPYRGAYDLTYRWEEGWTVVGDSLEAAPDATFPAWSGGALALGGDVSLQAFGGAVAFTDAAGRAVELPLGVLASEEPADAGLVSTRTTYGRMVFNGTLDGLVVPLDGEWAFGAPEVAWRVVGDVAFAGADGTVERDGDRRAFSGADVRVFGDVGLAVHRTPLPPTPFEPARHVGEGTFERVTVDGVAVVWKSQGEDLPAARATLAAALLALLSLFWKSLGALYTRIASDAALDHPVRRRIHETVTARPGVHKSALRREVGVAWGAFDFHLRLLARSGYVRIDEGGYYTRVFPPAAGVAPGIANPVAASVHREVPQDGKIAFAALRERTGLSRQLLTYHLRNLERDGHVRLAREGRSYVVERARTASR